MNHQIIVAQADVLSAAAQKLIAALNAELMALYPEPGANHFRLDADEVSEGRGAFVMAWRGSKPVGCGAVRCIDNGIGEIKRMFAIPEERGQGVGRSVLEALEAHAAKLGITRLVLETGIRQSAAVALYRKAGFVEIPPFGEYIASSATSLCMAKNLP